MRCVGGGRESEKQGDAQHVSWLSHDSEKSTDVIFTVQRFGMTANGAGASFSLPPMADVREELLRGFQLTQSALPLDICKARRLAAFPQCDQPCVCYMIEQEARRDV
jgi:hypothetical protein